MFEKPHQVKGPTMSAQTKDRPVDLTEVKDDTVVRLPRRTIDRLLIAFGVIAAAVFVVAGGLLTWGANFSNDYVHDELASQNIFFPEKAELEAEGRDDLVKYAGEQVTTGT